MFNGKMKALTFSYDDGVTQDIKFIELLNKYGLKGTFNINSSLLGLKGEVVVDNEKISHNKVKPLDVKHIYEGHEIAVHTMTHPNLTNVYDDIITYQVEKDRLALSELAGYEVIGMAYPCGGVNNDDRVAKVIKETTGVKYSRTITSVYNFDLQDNIFRFNPSVYHREPDKMLSLAEEFINLKPTSPQIFYVWGHSYELDSSGRVNWEFIEDFFKIISNKEDIFYGTNKEILLSGK